MENEENNLNKKIFILIIIITFLIEFLVREFLFSISIPIIIFLQRNFYYFYPIELFFSLFGMEKGIFLILIISYNISNILIPLILLSISLISIYIGGILKIIYQNERPFFINSEIKVLNCEGGFGNPSNHSLLSTFFYLSLYEIYVNKNEKINEKNKNLIYFLTIIFIFSIVFSRMFLGVHTLNQILFGSLIGFFLYFFMFKIYKFNQNVLFIIYNFKQIVFVIIFLIIFGFFNYYFFFNFDNKILYEKYNFMIEKNCPNFPIIKRLENESFYCIFVLSVLIFAVFGIYYEYYYIFSANVSKFIKYNFNNENENEINLLNNNVNNRWNKTNFNVSIKRFFVILIVCGILLIPYFFSSYDNNFFVVLVFKTLIPLYVIVFVLFSYMKKITGYFNLNNNSNNFSNEDDEYKNNLELNNNNYDNDDVINIQNK